jgi:hypothetical protein
MDKKSTFTIQLKQDNEIHYLTGAQIESWAAMLTEREHNELRFARLYAEQFAHGTDGHNRLLLIAKLADMLDEQQLQMTGAIEHALAATA